MSLYKIFEGPIWYDFSKEKLAEIYDISVKDLESHKQLSYLFKYLKEIECDMIIVEDNYVDKYYLDDYLHFYANCHTKYDKNCKRIHFFSKKFNFEKISRNINDTTKTIKELQPEYLGFTIKRPVSKTFVGRTLLKVYKDTNTCEENGNGCEYRNIIAIHKFKANLCGIDFEIESIPFQSQDNVVHACASTAIWTVLQQSTHKFGYYAPTPYEVKISAPNLTFHRPIPTSGLSTSEIIGAIRSFGMEVEINDYSGKKEPRYHNFSSFIYAYLRGGIPVLLGVMLVDTKKKKKIGGHALAALGYKLQENQPVHAKTFLTGNRIDKLYIHDDNLGPFSRYGIKSKSKDIVELTCEDRKTVEIIPWAIIAPVYHKIRYPYGEIVKKLNLLLNALINSNIFHPNIQKLEDARDLLEWDVYLTSINKLKDTYRRDKEFQTLDPELHEMVMQGFLPRFIWRCCLYNKNTPLFEILGDATEAKTQFPFIFSFCYNKLFKENLEEIFQKMNWRIMLDILFNK